jgi:hypothetical protein
MVNEKSPKEVFEQQSGSGCRMIIVAAVQVPAIL